MKNKHELSVAARELAESFLGETNQKKVKSAIIAKFDTLGLNDQDYPAFEQMVWQYKATAEGLTGQPLETEKIRIEAERKAVASAPTASPAAA